MASQDNLFTPGSTFGRYTIGRKLGAGGMGAVYEAVHIDLKKRVAIKTLLPDGAADPQWRARFLREGEAAARLRHPNVVDISDVGVLDGVPYLVMEFLDGEDFGHLLNRERSLPLGQLVDLMLPVLDAVAAAHDESIVHRDLKPENIFLARTRHQDAEPKLLDFGISKVSDMGAGPGLTATNTLMGTTVYMSPEQAQNSKDVDGRSDQYSLGVILYEAATGTHPFAEAGARDSLYELLTVIIFGRFEPPRNRRPDLPEAFEQVILRAMATRREDRYASVAELSRALLPFASDRGRAMWEPRLALRVKTDRNLREPQFPSVSSPPDDNSVTVMHTSLSAPPPAIAVPSVLPDVPRSTALGGGTLNASAVSIDIARRPSTSARGSRAWLYISSGVVLGILAVTGMVMFSHAASPENPTVSSTVGHPVSAASRPLSAVRAVVAPVVPVTHVPTPALVPPPAPAIASPPPAAPVPAVARPSAVTTEPAVPTTTGTVAPHGASGSDTAGRHRRRQRPSGETPEPAPAGLPPAPGGHIYY